MQDYGMLFLGRRWPIGWTGARERIFSPACRLRISDCFALKRSLRDSASARSWQPFLPAAASSSRRRIFAIQDSLQDQSGRFSTMASTDEAEIEPDYGFQEAVESFKGYVPGGYHPVHLGDELANGRYKIVHKLGYGAYSTVWLARDQLAEQYVAVKIAVAGLESSQENSILRHLLDANHKTLAGKGHNLVSSLLDEFQLDGPNGRHICLVSEPAGCTIADSKEAGRKWMFPLATARAIVTNLFQAVAFMHDNGVVHAGKRVVPLRSLTEVDISTTRSSFWKYPSSPRQSRFAVGRRALQPPGRASEESNQSDRWSSLRTRSARVFSSACLYVYSQRRVDGSDYLDM